MEKVGILKSEKMNQYEIENGKASYLTVVNLCIGDLVLCNNIAEIDASVFDNLELSQIYEEDYPEFYQFFLCHVDEWGKEKAKKAGLIFSYSDMLECDVLCVDHFGTSWDYVLTDAKIFETYEELEKYESNEN